MSTSNDDELSDSLIFGSPPSPAATAEFPFLDPPRLPDEIGRFGDFRVLRVLGRGGMGVVFEAEDRILKRTVALKVLLPRMAADRDYRERFLREARAIAALSSDHVVTIHQVGVIGETPYLTMQMLAGATLQERLERGPQLDVPTALRIARQVVVGLADVHRRGLIHRDVKPANIWLETDPDTGEFRRVRLLDFGLARRSSGEPGLTSVGTVVGTPWYMSPEQARGDSLDARTDLFSFGCVMYRMLTGELAFPGDSTMTVFAALANDIPPSATIRNPAVPPPLAALVARLLAKERDDRPATAAETIELLDAASAIGPIGEPLRAPRRPPPPPPATGGLETQPLAAHDTHPDEPTGPRTAAPDPHAAWRWKWTERIAGISLTLATIVLAIYLAFFRPSPQPIGPAGMSGEPIKIGVLHSQSGHMSSSEKPVVDATLLAIEELNQKGGVLGRKLVPIEADGRSDPAVFASEATRLLKVEEVAAIFGCWTSASRKAVREVVERDNGLLFYPVQYEGLEQSPHIVYLGPTPNQQIFPALDYLTGPEGGRKKRIALIGSDYVYPRAVLELLKDWVKTRDGVTLVESQFLPLGSKDVGEAVDALVAAKPDLILNTINGSTNFRFFPKLRSMGIARVPVLSASISENELQAFKPADLAGDYLTGSYFQSAESPANREFLRKFRSKYGETRIATEMMAAAYGGVHLWAAAATEAGTTGVDAVKAAIRGREYSGPRGGVRIHATNGHTAVPWMLGQVQADGAVRIIRRSERMIEPIPYPGPRTQPEWDRFLYGLYIGWDSHWQAPEPRTGKEQK